MMYIGILLQGSEFPLHVKDIPKFGRLRNLKINVFEVDKTISTIYINSSYTEPQMNLLLFENHYFLRNKLHCLIKKAMKHVCRRCLTAISSEDILNQHMERCKNKNVFQLGT